MTRTRVVQLPLHSTGACTLGYGGGGDDGVRGWMTIHIAPASAIGGQRPIDEAEVDASDGCTLPTSVHTSRNAERRGSSSTPSPSPSSNSTVSTAPLQHAGQRPANQDQHTGPLCAWCGVDASCGGGPGKQCNGHSWRPDMAVQHGQNA